jgi:Ni/Co efflux regulator RcnB
MRKAILLGLMMAAAIPTAANAQRGELRRDRREVHQDRREVVQDRRELRRDRRSGAGAGELRRDRREIRQDRREVVQDRRELGRDRVRHAYAAPYRGWSYRRVNRGFVLRPLFWGPRYVVDWRFYHLRAPFGYQRWIRYGDDLLLVDIRTGRVIDVIYNRYY